MFTLDETQEARHARLRQFSGKEAAIGVILAAVDFEWTLRRCIIACGQSPNVVIRTEVLAKVRRIKGYSDPWNKEVFPRFGVRLGEVVTNWDFVRENAFRLRNRLMHGIIGSVEEAFAVERRDAMMDGSKALWAFANRHGIDVYSKLPVRRVKRSLSSV